MSSLRLLVTLAVCFSALTVHAAETNDETSARKAATDVAGAFANEGFKTRDGFWIGVIQLHGQAVVAVNLYAGNQYWFSAGANGRAKKIGVDVFDETGQRMATEPYSAGEKAAAGFSPTNSGQYFVAVSLVEGEAAECCLVYS